MSNEINTFYISFWGTRGSIPTPGNRTDKYGGNTSCITVRCKETEVIFDAGTGLRNLGIDLIRKFKESTTQMQLHLLLSHTHWDHIQGLPFFAPAHMDKTKLIIYGSPKKESFLEAILQRQMDVNYFPVEMNALASDISIREFEAEAIKINDLEITWQEQVLHPGGSVRYRIAADDKKIVYATDLELNKIFNEAGQPTNMNLAAEYLAFIQGADLLIADGQYTEEEYPTKVGWGHTTMALLGKIAHQTNVKQLAVFHHDPLHSDMMLDKLWPTLFSHYTHADPPMKVFWAREGMTVVV